MKNSIFRDKETIKFSLLLFIIINVTLIILFSYLYNVNAKILKLQNKLENRTFYVLDLNNSNTLKDNIKKIHNITYEKSEEDSMLETYIIVLDNYKNYNNLLKEIDNYDYSISKINSDNKIDLLVRSSTVLKVFTIIVSLAMLFMIIMIINTIIGKRNTNIALKKVFGYSNNKISFDLFIELEKIYLLSFFISTLLFIIVSVFLNNMFFNNLLPNIIIMFIYLLLVTLIIFILNIIFVNKIKKISPLVFFYDN